MYLMQCLIASNHFDAQSYSTFDKAASQSEGLSLLRLLGQLLHLLVVQPADLLLLLLRLADLQLVELLAQLVQLLVRALHLLHLLRLGGLVAEEPVRLLAVLRRC